MRNMKNKKVTNSSFLSNHDLLQNFRNKSFKLITRQASLSQLKQIPKKVSLIAKKNYQKSIDNKQNQPLLSNRKVLNINKGQTQRQKQIYDTKQTYQLKLNKQQKQNEINTQQQINKIIKQLNFIYDQINMQQIELKMILNKNIRKIKDIFNSKGPSNNDKRQNNSDKQNIIKQLEEKVMYLNQKIQDQSKKLLKYKKLNHQNQDKINIYELQVTSLQTKLEQQKKINQSVFKQNIQKLTYKNKINPNQNNQTLVTQNNQPKQTNTIQIKQQERQDKIQILQNIIDTQQELINRQMSDFQAQNQQFLRILHTQALQIQQLINPKQNISSNPSTKRFNQQPKSTAYQSRYDSNTSYRGNSVNTFSSFNSPQKTQELIARINKKKPKQPQFSICLY